MKPFEGVRVLDLTHVLAGPFSTYQLACLGADVIKIEAPDNPDMTRIEGVDVEFTRQHYGSYFQAQNAGKRAITLDLKTPMGADALWRLIDTADVLVQNYAGDSLEKLGFGYPSVAKRNSRLIYCSITGFGRTGAKASHAAYDVVIQSYSGLMKANGNPPVRVGPPMVDYGTGAQAAFAISAALYQREQTQTGQYIDVSMADAAMMLMSASVVDTLITGNAPQPHGNTHPGYAGYATFNTAEGLLMVGAWTNKQLAALLTVLGEKTRADAVLQTDRQTITAEQSTDSALIAGHLLTRSAEEWEQRLNDAHVPAARVRSLDEAVQEAQIAERGVFQSPPESRPGCPPRFPVTAFSYQHGTPTIDRAPPYVGEHTDEILTEIGIRPEDYQS